MASETVDDVDTENTVRLVGRLSRLEDERELPSGSVVVGFAVVVPRALASPSGRNTVDSLDCAAWSAGTRRSVRSWQVGDVVEVEGHLRRRFYRAGAGVASRYEVEAVRVKRRRRGPAA